MFNSPPVFAVRGARHPRLGQRIALVLFVKIVGLAVLWFLFVRDQRVEVDAQRTATAFGLAKAGTVSTLK